LTMPESPANNVTMKESDPPTTNGSNSGTKLTFGFSKKIVTTKVATSVIADPTLLDNKEETDFVVEVTDKGVKGTIVREEKHGPLVIPCKAVNDWTFRDGVKERVGLLERIGSSEDVPKKEKSKERLVQKREDKPKAEDDEAVKELIEQAMVENEEWAGRTERSGFENLAVPLLMQNKVPEGFEEDEGPLNVELRPEESTLEDYESVPIEEYGLAMLRGMGWKAGEGIGKTRKGVAAPVETTVRPKGLGLGADRSALAKEEKKRPLKPGDVRPEDAPNAPLVMKPSANLVITSGKHKDLYGTVDGLDEDNCRVIVRLAISSQVVTLPQAIVNLVTKKEFDKYSKYLNKGSVDAYRAKKEEEEEGKKDEIVINSDGEDRSDHNSKKRKKEKKKKAKEDDHDLKSNGHLSAAALTEEGIASLWPMLRVRIISRTFKGGKYYSSKVIIDDVSTPTTCVCRTEEGKVLEVNKEDLESVIPKVEGAFVRIICDSRSSKHHKARRKLVGKLGEILKRDKANSQVVVRMLDENEDEEEIVTLSYDDVCEHVGGH